MLGALIGAGASLLGGYLNSQSSKDNNAALIADKEKDRQTQREFAQNGIQWKAADAKAAGIHPLYAMGANTVSYAPSSVGTSSSDAMGNAVSSAGSDISRAVTASASESTREESKVATALSLKNQELQNELLSVQIAKQRAQLGPPMPTLLSPGGNKIKDKELEQTAEALPETRSYRFLGLPLRTNPYFSDAESLENRGGNAAEAVQGAANIPADIAYTLYHDYPHLLNALGGGYATRRYKEQSSRRGYRPGLE